MKEVTGARDERDLTPHYPVSPSHLVSPQAGALPLVEEKVDIMSMVPASLQKKDPR